MTSRILSWGRGARDNPTQAKSAADGVSPSAMRELSDEDLLRRLHTKDEEALAELFDRHAKWVFGIVFRVLQDRGEAEEMVQELFLHLVSSAERFDPSKGPAKGWISHLAVHKAIDRRGFLKRRQFYDRTNLDLVVDSVGGATDIEGELVRESLSQQLRRALEELPPKQRITLEWYFFEGVPLREISDRLGETYFNIRHHFYRGLKKLRESPVVTRLKGESS